MCGGGILVPSSTSSPFKTEISVQQVAETLSMGVIQL